jgi:hypothetical protein
MSETATLPNYPFAPQVPIVAQVEVLVVGGGPAGIGAALGAARAGARVALVEQYGFLGGAATVAGVGPLMTSFSADGQTQLIGGVFDELVRRMEAIGGATHPSKVRAGSAECGFYVFGHDHVTPFDGEALKLVAAELMEEAGVELWLHTSFVAPMQEGEWLRGAVVHSKSGLQGIAARVVVDCTADADVAYRAGVPTLQGRPGDGLTQPLTMFFRVGNVDDAAVIAHAAAHPEEEGQLFHAIVEEAKKAGAFHIARDKVGLYRMAPGVWRVNTSRMQRLDGTNGRDLAQAEVEGRRQVAELMRFFRDWLPGFAHALLLDTAPAVGVRETRRIVGVYTLDAEDLRTGRHFEDGIALGSFPVDLHPETGDGGGTATGLARGYSTANIYEIPYACLLPQRAEQLLVAGRCLSASREALAAVRVMPTCFATGQAAGAAAALAVAEETAPRQVPAARLRATLTQQGAILR